MDDIILVGFGGHAKSIVDCIERSQQFHILGYTDVRPAPVYRGCTYLGPDDTLSDYYKKGVKNAVIAIGYLGNNDLRDHLYQNLKRIGYKLPVIQDPSAIIARDVRIGEGSVVGKNAVINAAAVVGKMCIINTGAVVEHDNKVGDFSHIAVNCTLCGNVTVGDHCLIGAGTTVIQNTAIGSGSLIGIGSTVLRNVTAGETVYGLVRKERISF